jgi:nucleoside-diphosphate-sugar epimerase
VRQFLGDECNVYKACFALAGPVLNNKCKITNLPWPELDAAKLQEELNIEVWLSYKSDQPEYFKPYFGFKHNVLKGDITEIKLDPESFDVIIHSSGYAQPSKFLDDRIKTININTEATTKLLNSLKKDGKFLFVSSSEVYSGNDNFNITESDIGTSTPDHNRACYIESKRCGETICHTYTLSGYHIKIARLSLAYGRFTKKGDSRVLSNIIDKGLNKDTITLMDDGSSIRTYCYITDIIEMFWNILLFGKYTTYNVAGFSKVSIKELATLVGDKLFVAGGRTSHASIGKVLNETIGEVDVYDFKLGTWSNIQMLSWGRGPIFRR